MSLLKFINTYKHVGNLDKKKIRALKVQIVILQEWKVMMQLITQLSLISQWIPALRVDSRRLANEGTI